MVVYDPTREPYTIDMLTFMYDLRESTSLYGRIRHWITGVPHNTNLNLTEIPRIIRDGFIRRSSLTNRLHLTRRGRKFIKEPFYYILGIKTFK